MHAWFPLPVLSLDILAWAVGLFMVWSARAWRRAVARSRIVFRARRRVPASANCYEEDDLEDRTLRQLLWIKWILVAVGLLVAVPMVVFTLIIASAVLDPDANSTKWKPSGSASSFKDKAGELLLAGKEQEVLRLALAREPQFPKDPDVHYYRARAYFQIGEYERAMESFAVTESIMPGWRDQYTGPFAREAKRRLASPNPSGNAERNRGTEPPTDPNEAYQLQLKKAAEQQQRSDQLLTLQEQQIKRFGAVLDRWEKSSGVRAP